MWDVDSSKSSSVTMRTGALCQIRDAASGVTFSKELSRLASCHCLFLGGSGGRHPSGWLELAALLLGLVLDLL